MQLYVDFDGTLADIEVGEPFNGSNISEWMANESSYTYVPTPLVEQLLNDNMRFIVLTARGTDNRTTVSNFVAKHKLLCDDIICCDGQPKSNFRVRPSILIDDDRRNLEPGDILYRDGVTHII